MLDDDASECNSDTWSGEMFSTGACAAISSVCGVILEAFEAISGSRRIGLSVRGELFRGPRRGVGRARNQLSRPRRHISRRFNGLSACVCTVSRR